MQSKQSDQITQFIMSPAGASVFMAAGALAILISFYLFWQGAGQSKWSGTYGKVTYGSVCRVGRMPYRYSVRLGYTYNVEGKEYTGSCDISPENPTSPNDANALMAKYWPNGRALEVYYDPKHPSSSVQDKTGTSGNGVGFLLFGILFIVAGVGINRVTKK